MARSETGTTTLLAEGKLDFDDATLRGEKKNPPNKTTILLFL